MSRPAELVERARFARWGPKPQPGTVRPINAALFMSHVSPCPLTGCWWWTASSTGGYGQFTQRRVKPGLYYAHRASWELHVGPIPAGMVVCHRCDQPFCVNPEHLFIGTQLDNLRDMHRKGRARGGGLSGEAAPSAKLTAAEVEEIRAIWEGGTVSQGVLARWFGVDQTHVSRIVRRAAWRHAR